MTIHDLQFKARLNRLVRTSKQHCIQNWFCQIFFMPLQHRLSGNVLLSDSQQKLSTKFSARKCLIATSLCTLQELCSVTKHYCLRKEWFRLIFCLKYQELKASMLKNSPNTPLDLVSFHLDICFHNFKQRVRLAADSVLVVAVRLGIVLAYIEEMATLQRQHINVCNV